MSGHGDGWRPTRQAAAREVHARDRCAPRGGAPRLAPISAPRSSQRANGRRSPSQPGTPVTPWTRRHSDPCTGHVHAHGSRTGGTAEREGEPTRAPRSRARARRTLPPGRRRGGAGVPAPAWETGSDQAERRLQGPAGRAGQAAAALAPTMHATRRCGGGQGRTAVAARGCTERSLPGGAAGGGGGPPWGWRRLHLESSKLTLPPSMSSSGTRLGRAAGSWACGSGSVVARCARVSSARGAGAEFAHQPTRSPATLEALACRILVRGWCGSNFGGGVGCPGLGHNPSFMAPIAGEARSHSGDPPASYGARARLEP